MAVPPLTANPAPEAVPATAAAGAPAPTPKSPGPYHGWQQLVKPYTQPDLRKSVWQVVNSFGGLFLGFALMCLAQAFVGYWLALLLAVPTAGFLVRVFIIQHDAGHGSFFKSKRWNDVVGAVAGVLTLTPYNFWRKTHAIHHAHHAELEERGIGDVWTMTVDEYDAAPRWRRLAYRVFRNPFFLFLVVPTVNFLVVQRFPVGAKKGWRTGEVASVWWTNLAVAGLVAGVSLVMGFWTALALMLPVMVLGASVGTWLFYVQHQFERTYWEHTPTWDYTLAAMEGSSYYQLPKVLQWFTGNIGYHHIHHLSPRIPNYNLEACHEDNELFRRVVHLSLGDSLKTTRLALWDEENRRLVPFAAARRSGRATATA